jgi:hypothetical protein
LNGEALMNEFESDTPVEELPGILGYQFDDHDFVSLSEATDALSSSFIRDFEEQIWLLENELPVKVTLNSIETDFFVKPKIPLFELMDKLPAIDIKIDCPPNQGPGGGSGYLIFLADGYNLQQAKDQLNAFIKSMTNALVKMKALNDS